jgi:NADH:ubiquinone oxidoreductase subunit F (NADH-binding)
MENDPHLLIEGMIIGAYAIGASKGYIYIRGEYAKSIRLIRKAVKDAGSKGYLGKNIAGSEFSMEIEVRTGAGSYLGGDGFSMLETIEGKRGTPRVRPPLAMEKGLFGKPTLINNVETLAHLPSILLNGGEWYATMGTATSKGTKIFTVTGDVVKPGYYEVLMGTTLRTLINDLAGGMKEGMKFKAVLLGGAAGTFVPEEFLDTPLCYDAMHEKGFHLGAGAVIVFSEERNIADVVSSLLGFFRYNSCGKCVPCRVGTTLLTQMASQVKEKGADRDAILSEMLKQAKMMAGTSLCAVGQSPVMPLGSAMKYFRNDF